MSFFRAGLLCITLAIIATGCTTPADKVVTLAIALKPDVAVSKAVVFDNGPGNESGNRLEETEYQSFDDLPDLPVVAIKRETVPDLPQFILKKPEDDKKTLAVQVLLFDCDSLYEVEERIRELKKDGFNTIIFRVFHNRGDRSYYFAKGNSDRGVYYKTSHAPVVADILGAVADISHRNGMDIYAWMTTRYADYGVEERPGWQARSYDLESGKYKEAKGLNLFNPNVQDHLAGLYKDLARYDIDGILFQDDLVLRQTEGFSREAINEFTREYMMVPDPETLYKDVYQSKEGKFRVGSYGADFREWSRWKNRHLMDLAENLMKEVKAINPEMKFAINFMYEAATDPNNALAWLSQDMEEAVKRGFDLYAIMAYHRQMEDELNLDAYELEKAIAKLVRKTIKVVGDADKALIKLQIVDWKSGKVIPAAEVKNILDVIKENGRPSIAFVPYRNDFNFKGLASYLQKPHIPEMEASFVDSNKELIFSD